MVGNSPISSEFCPRFNTAPAEYCKYDSSSIFMGLSKKSIYLFSFLKNEKDSP